MFPFFLQFVENSLDLERSELQSMRNIALSVQIAAAGVATSFMLILFPNIESISLTAFLLGYLFKKKFAITTTLVMVITWEILATLVFSTSGIIFFFKVLGWLIIVVMGMFARYLQINRVEIFSIFGIISGLVFDFLVTIPYALLNATGPENFVTIFLSSLFVGLYFSIFHMVGNAFLFALIPVITVSLHPLLQSRFSDILHSTPQTRIIKNRVIFIFLLILLVSTIIFVNKEPKAPEGEVKTIQITQKIFFGGVSLNITQNITTTSDQSAFQILNQSMDITYRVFGSAHYVVSINSVFENQNISNFYWIFYVNGIRSDYGADFYFPIENDYVLWSYESN